jgi:serine protease Do
MNSFYKFSGMLVGLVAIAISVPRLGVALEATKIYDIAQGITVLVDGQNPGSGITIAKQGDTYYVLTAKHVVATPDEYEIVTSDRQRYPLDYSSVKKLPNVDLAIISFNSKREYKLASLADSKEAKPGAVVHIYGFPNPGREIKERIPQFTSGEITANAPLKDGYALVYTNVTRAGMSGGPVLNDRGLVVGVHGRAESEASSDGNESGSGTAGKIGFNLGIPIATFVSLAKQAGINVAVEQTAQSTSDSTSQVETVPETPVSSPTGISRPAVVRPSFQPETTVCAGRNCE